MLVIEDDEWVSRLLSNAIRDAGYDVLASATAKEGFEVACAEEPSCIICDVELPDGDGFWVARSIRTQDSRVSVTPFIFLSGLDDPESRMEGYQVGGDVYITKPFRIQEVVAHIESLVQMAERMRRQREAAEGPAQGDAGGVDIPIDIDLILSETPPPNEGQSGDDRDAPKEGAPAKVSAIEGDLSQMSIATVLTVLEMERRTGLFEVVSKKRRAQLEIAAGTVVQGTVGGTRVSALTTLRTMLGWTVGRFSFTPLPTREAPANRKTIGAFLLEAVRLEDEAMRDELELPPSRRMPGQKLTAPALGGPASTADDLAPLSSRAMSLNPPSVAAPTPRMSAQPATSVYASAAPARALARGSSEPPPSAKVDVEPVPMSQAQPTMDLDIEPISVQPVAGSPIFPGLASITGTYRNPKPASKPAPAAAPKAPPLPPKAGQSTPPQAPRPVSTPPPLPKRETSTTGARVAVVPPPPPRPAAKPAVPPPLPARPAPPPLPRPENPPKKR